MIRICILFTLTGMAPAFADTDWEEERHPAASTSAQEEGSFAGQKNEAPDNTYASADLSKEETGNPGRNARTLLQGSAKKAGILPGGNNDFHAGTPAPDRGLLTALDADFATFIAGAKKNQRTPPAAFKTWLTTSHPNYALASRSVAQNAVCNIKGQWDESQKILDNFGIRYLNMSAREFRTASLDNTRIVIVNCAGDLSRENIQKIRDFVARGGYLLTTDWALAAVVQRAFPGFVEWSGQNTDNLIVDSYLLTQDPALLKGIPQRRTLWKLDQGSQMVKICHPGRVEVLARSAYLARFDSLRRDPYLDPALFGVLAFQFKFGKGKVLHLVGHFENNSSLAKSHNLPDPMPDGSISLRQALAANFLLEALSIE